MRLAVTDADLSLIQECVALATNHPELSAFWTDAIAYVLGIMDAVSEIGFDSNNCIPRP